VLCGIVPTFWVLIVGRVIQGLAGGLLLPVAIATLFRTFPPNERGLALGFFAIPMVAGPALGPTIGGYIVTNLEWRLVFFVNLPIGIATFMLSLFLMRREAAGHAARFDFVGAIFSTLGFGLCLYGLSRVSDDGWDSLSVLGCLAGGGISLVTFLVYEVFKSDPLLNVRLFAIPQFMIANIVGWVSTVALFGAEFMLPLYLQNLRGLSAVDTGLLLMPQGFSSALVGPIAGRLTDKFGARYIVVVGFVLLAINTWQLSQLTLETSYGTLRLLLLLRGAALGLSLQPTQLTALAVVPPRATTNASSLTSAMRNVFQSFGIAMLSNVVQTQTSVHQTVLSWQVTPWSTSGAFLAQISQSLQAAQGLAPAAAQRVAAAMLSGQIAQQAAVLAFADAYRITFYAAVIAFALAWLLPGPGAARRASGEMVVGH
jgi:DHA2 family multidrug resistance protein